MFKCPYCQQDSYAKSSKKKGKFESWKAVKGHSSYCVKSTGEYFIDTNEGPIHFNEVLNITNIDFRKIWLCRLRTETCKFMTI